MPTVVLVWASALAGGIFDASRCAALAGVLAVAGGFLLVRGPRQGPGGARIRTVPATLALACILGAAAAAHCALTAANRETGPLAQPVASGDGVVIEMLITGSPEAAPTPGQSGSDRWSVAATLRNVTYNGSVVRGAADLVVVGGHGWQDVHPGQQVRTTGTLKAARERQSQAALLSASSAPVVTGVEWDLRAIAGDLRRNFVDAADWLPPDAAGLLPGMVTGDTSALPESLKSAMQTTGMTHLTAVSGANCSLVLGGFIVVARCMRLPRPAAGIFAAGGLVAFVVMVGPDPSVLRAAVMGCVGLAALAGGLRGRSLSFLCLASTILLVLDPSLAGNVGFLLSVLATLGIVLLASRMASWMPARVPRWLAAGVTVPLSAQLLCGPVIVALQPQFTPYALIANIVAGPLVAPVTILGTIAVPVAAVVPLLAVFPIAVAGTSSGVVAGLARFFAGLPGASLPWADGPAGVVAMAVCSVVTVVTACMMLHPAGVVHRVTALHGAIVVFLERRDSKRRASSGR